MTAEGRAAARKREDVDASDLVSRWVNGSDDKAARIVNDRIGTGVRIADTCPDLIKAIEWAARTIRERGAALARGE